MATEIRTLADIYAKVDWWQARYDRAHDRRAQAERTLEQAGKHLGVVPMVRQICDLLQPHFPNQTLSVLGPFGLGHTTSINAYPLGSDHHGARPPKVLGSLTFRPYYDRSGPDRPERLELIDYSRDTGQFAPGSLGAYNGLNYEGAPVPEIGELIDLLWKQIKEKAA